MRCKAAGMCAASRVMAVEQRVCPSRDTRWRTGVRSMVSHWTFSALILVFIIVNTAILAMDHHPMDKDFRCGTVGVALATLAARPF